MVIAMRADSELMVITKAKDIVSYWMLISENAPKKYRFTLISKMQNTGLDVLEDLILANEAQLGTRERYDYQKQAIAKLKVLDALSMIGKQSRCILPKQYEYLSRLIADGIKLTGAWINSDKKRMKSTGI